MKLLLFIFFIFSSIFVIKSDIKRSKKEKLIMDSIYKYEKLFNNFGEKKINYNDSYFDSDLLAKDIKNKIEIYLIHLYRSHTCDYFIILKNKNILFIKPDKDQDIRILDSILINNNFDKNKIDIIKNETIRIQKCLEEGFLLKSIKCD